MHSEQQQLTYVIGASPKPERYAFLAAQRLKSAGRPLRLLGTAVGKEVLGMPIEDLRQRPELAPPHTLTLYMGAARQADYEDYLLSLEPLRIIFNPGAENPSLEKKAQERGIETMNACTLVMLASGIY